MSSLTTKRCLQKFLLGTASVAVVAASATAQANMATHSGVELRLADVLNRFASDADVEIMFSQSVGEERVGEAPALSGDPRADLDRILQDTGLRFEEPSQNVFVITNASTTVPSSEDRSTTERKAPSADQAIATQRKAEMQAVQPAPMAAESTTTAAPAVFDLDAPTGVISGQVLDRFTGQPLAGAILEVDGLGQTAVTDIRGFYRFPTAPAGSYSLSVNYLGSSFPIQTVTVSSGEAVELNFAVGDENTDELVVYGNRSALQQALNQQRAALNSSTVVSSDLLGDFPAENIAEALRRVSGVTFSRDDESGQGNRITIRGFNEQAINIQLNGVNLQGTGIDRGIDLTGFLTDNIKQVTIQKSLLPSQEATGTGGLVQIETRSGLDYGERYFSVGAEYEAPFASGFGDEYEFSATGAYQLTDNFGVSATVQYRDTSSENFDINFLQVDAPVLPEGFTSSFSLPESFDYPFVAEAPGPFVTGGNYFARARDEENLTLSFNAAYDWSDHSRLRLDVQRIENDTATSSSRSTQSSLTSSTLLPVPELDGDVRRRFYVRSLRPTLGIDDGQSNLETTSISFRGETDVDRWEFDYKIGYSETVRDRLRTSASFLGDQNATVSDLIDPATARFDLDDDGDMTPRLVGGVTRLTSNGIPFLSLSQGGIDFVTDPSTYNGFTASLFDARDQSESWVYEADARRYFSNSILDYIEVGGRFDDINRDNSDDVLSTTNITSSQSFVRIRNRDTPLNDLISGGLNSRDLSLIGAGAATVPFLDFGSSAAIVEGMRGLLEDDPNTPENEQRFNFTDRTLDNPIDDAGAISPAEITEKIYAAYIESKVDIGDLEIVGGVRFQRDERTGNIISAPSVRDAGGQSVPRATFADLGLVEFRTTDTSDETWTPSVIANYRPSDQAVIRGAYFRSTINPSVNQIARPTQIIVDLRPRFLSARIREPNPNLAPTITDNFDLDFSYYFKDNPGLVRLGLFYKDVSNNFTDVLIADEETDASIRDRIVSELSALSSVDPALLQIPDDAEFTIQQPRNGDGGSIYGVELELIRQLDFLPESWPSFVENFSVLGNLTYTKSEFDVLETARNDDGDLFTLTLPNLPLERQSEWAGNASLRYDDGAFSGAIIYTYQSDAALSYDEFNLNGIVPEFDTLDLRMSYVIDRKDMPRIILFAEGDDLLRGSEEADLRLATGSKFANSGPDFFFPDRIQFNGGRRFTVGARMTF